MVADSVVPTVPAVMGRPYGRRRVRTIAAGVNADGPREVLGMAVGSSQAEFFWLDCLRSLKRCGLAGVKRVVSADHEDLKAPVTKVLAATWRHCCVHSARNALAHAGNAQRRIVPAWIGTALPGRTRMLRTPSGRPSPTSSTPRCRSSPR
jgi:hypothetical protein